MFYLMKTVIYLSKSFGINPVIFCILINKIKRNVVLYFCFHVSLNNVYLTAIIFLFWIVSLCFNICKNIAFAVLLLYLIFKVFKGSFLFCFILSFFHLVSISVNIMIYFARNSLTIRLVFLIGFYRACVFL